MFPEDIWEDFIDKKIVVSCKTEEGAKVFIQFCIYKGIKWLGGEDMLTNNFWNIYKKNTLYSAYSKEYMQFGTDTLGRKIYIFKNKQLAKCENCKIYNTCNKSRCMLNESK